MDANRLQQLSDDQLIREIYETDGASPSHLPLTGEFQRRQLLKVQQEVQRLAKPHPLLVLTFIVAVIGTATSVIGYWPQIVAVFRSLLSFFSSHGRP